MTKHNSTIYYALEAWKTLALSIPLSTEGQSWHASANPLHTEAMPMSALAWQDLQTAIEQYQLWQQTPLYRIGEFPVAWEERGTRLYDLGGAGQRLLLVPSMINRPEILHMPNSASLANYFKSNGFHVYLLDWGFENDASRKLSMSDLQMRLAAASGAIGESALLGYCLGGTLAHLTHLPKVTRQVLLGVPWRFQHEQGRVGYFAQYLKDASAESIDTELWRTELAFGLMPSLYVDYLFAVLNPLQFVQKFRNRGERDDLELFDALEDWLTSGQNLPMKVAHSLLKTWFRDDKLLDVKGLNRPTLAVYGRKDHIAPPISCQAIAQTGENVQLLEHNAGHVGLLVGKQSQSAVWPRLVNYLHSQSK